MARAIVMAAVRLDGEQATDTFDISRVVQLDGDALTLLLGAAEVGLEGAPTSHAAADAWAALEELRQVVRDL